MRNVILNCIVCDKELAAAFPSEAVENQPYGGTTFSTNGHYGSTVFDPFDWSETLEINICDPCLAEKAEENCVIHNRAGETSFWNPGLESSAVVTSIKQEKPRI